VVSRIQGYKAVVDDLPGKGGYLVSEKNRAPEDEQPLARPVHEQELARSVSGDQEEATQAESEQQEAPRAGEERAETPQEELEEQQGLISRAVDKAREKGLVDEATVDKAQEKGLIDKADEVIDKVRNKLTGG
jgi:hypothetical protein